MKRFLLFSLAFAVFLSITAYKVMRGKAQPIYLPSMETRAINQYPAGTISYKYDDKNRMVEIISELLPKFVIDSKLSYDDQDRLTMADGNITPDISGNAHHNKTYYTYYKGCIVGHGEEQSIGPRGTSEQAFSDTMILNERQQVVKRITCSYLKSKKTKYYECFRYDERGNLVWQVRYDSKDTVHAQDTSTYVYGDSKSPFANVRGNYTLSPALLDGYNNYTSKQSVEPGYTLYGTTVAPCVRNSTFNYKLNAAGYPVKAVGKEVDTDLKPYKVHQPFVTTIKYSYIVR